MKTSTLLIIAAVAIVVYFLWQRQEMAVASATSADPSDLTNDSMWQRQEMAVASATRAASALQRAVASATLTMPGAAAPTTAPQPGQTTGLTHESAQGRSHFVSLGPAIRTQETAQGRSHF